MKRLTIALTLIISFIVTSDALTYRQSASFLKGGNTTTDTVNVTPSERIMAMHVIMCARASRGMANFVRESYTNYEQFSDAQFVEFYTRGMNSGLQGYVLSQIIGSSNVDLYGTAVTDTQLESSYKNVMFGLIRIIGTGSL